MNILLKLDNDISYALCLFVRRKRLCGVFLNWRLRKILPEPIPRGIPLVLEGGRSPSP